MFKLIIEDDEGKTTVVPLIRDEITIGRKEGNTIRLTERNVSRRHAKLTKANGSVFIEDLQSYNGIKVNGDRIAGRAPIAEGDRIQTGDYQLGAATVVTPNGAPTPEPEKAARLVVVSSNFAGLEHKLEKASSQIGRTQDNDMVVNHRSISRNHAKIVKEQGRYHIVDLGSAN